MINYLVFALIPLWGMITSNAVFSNTDYDNYVPFGNEPTVAENVYYSSLDEINERLKTNPDNTNTLCWRANLHAGRHYFELAFEDVKKIALLGDSSYDFLLMSAHVKYRLNDFQGSIEDLNKCNLTKPNAFVNYIVLGLNYIALGDSINACSNFRKAVDYGSPEGMKNKYCTGIPESTDIVGYDDFVKTTKEPVVDLKKISRNTVYPELARRGSIEGRVMVGLLIDANGKLVRKKVAGTDSIILCESALDAIDAHGDFIPAYQDDEPVACWIHVPIVFKLK